MFFLFFTAYLLLTKRLKRLIDVNVGILDLTRENSGDIFDPAPFSQEVS